MWPRPVQEHNCRKKTWKIRMFLDRVWDDWEIKRELSVSDALARFKRFKTIKRSFIRYFLHGRRKLHITFNYDWEKKSILPAFLFVTCSPPRYSPQIDTNKKSCSFAFGTFWSISQLKIGIKNHSTVLHVPFSLSVLFLLLLSHNVFFLISRKEKSNRQQTSNSSHRWGGEISLECRGWMKKTSTAYLHMITLVIADWYGSDSSWLISQIKIIETMKLFSPKLLGPN